MKIIHPHVGPLQQTVHESREPRIRTQLIKTENVCYSLRGTYMSDIARFFCKYLLRKKEAQHAKSNKDISFP